MEPTPAPFDIISLPAPVDFDELAISCNGLTAVIMNDIVDGKGSPTKVYFGTEDAECIIGTMFSDTIYGNGGSVCFEIYSFLCPPL